VRGFQRGLGFTLFNLDKRLTQTGQGAGPLPTNGASTYPQNASSAKSGFGIRSYFATAKYTYDNKYSLNANIRRDGTSRIVNEENREVTSWSAGFTWNALQEHLVLFQILVQFLLHLMVQVYNLSPTIKVLRCQLLEQHNMLVQLLLV
jgi:hypothetical protein